MASATVTMRCMNITDDIKNGFTSLISSILPLTTDSMIHLLGPVTSIVGTNSTGLYPDGTVAPIPYAVNATYQGTLFWVYTTQDAQIVSILQNVQTQQNITFDTWSFTITKGV